jgi:subtilase family serine protease
MEKISILTTEDLQTLKNEILLEISKMLNTYLSPKNHKEYLTTEEVKEMFGVKSVNTIKKYLIPKKFGNRNLYALSEIMKNLEG